MTVFLVHPARPHESPHEALANMQDTEAASQAFAARWGSLWEEKMVAAIAPVFERGELEQVYRVQRDNLRRAWRGDKDAHAHIEDMGMGSHFHWHFKGKKAEVIPEDLWSAIAVLFLRDHALGRTAICANPNCTQPYFVRKRNTQKYCDSGPCVEYGARLRANLWWAKHGEDWRKKSRAKKGKRS